MIQIHYFSHHLFLGDVLLLQLLFWLSHIICQRQTLCSVGAGGYLNLGQEDLLSVTSSFASSAPVSSLLSSLHPRICFALQQNPIPVTDEELASWCKSTPLCKARSSCCRGRRGGGQREQKDISIPHPARANPTQWVL